MGPDLGRRAVNKVDLFIFPIVLLLRVSLLVLALLRFSIKIFLQGFNYMFSHGQQTGIHQEFMPTAIYILYLMIRVLMLTLYFISNKFSN
jgi:hypothetical protein